MRQSVVVAVVVLAVGMVTAAGPAAAAVTRAVDDDGVQCPAARYASIQAAVDAAGPGDTVLVCDGAYREQVTIGAGKDGLRLRAQVLRRAIIQAPGGGG